MSTKNLVLRAARASQRRCARWFARRPFLIEPTTPLVSFTFDDFPTSALNQAGTLLAERGAGGTYYASFGLAGQDAPTGRIFNPTDLAALYQGGHELGCHTFHHCHSWETPAVTFEASVRDNLAALQRHCPGRTFTSLSYPISHPRPATKRRMGRRFLVCRGGGQRFNRGPCDLNYLGAFFIEQSLDRPESMLELIDANARAKGWLIFATHDVTQRPTRFGCTPGVFESLVDRAVDSGAKILTVAQAATLLGIKA